jgi:hypothetical protein
MSRGCLKLLAMSRNALCDTWFNDKLVDTPLRDILTAR